MVFVVLQQDSPSNAPIAPAASISDDTPVEDLVSNGSDNRPKQTTNEAVAKTSAAKSDSGAGGSSTQPMTGHEAASVSGAKHPGASDTDSTKSAEINTTKGRLVLTTSNEGTDLKIVIEKPGADGKIEGKTVRVSGNRN